MIRNSNEFTSRYYPLRDNAEVTGIYISWPFCAQKCTYCNFASGVQPRGLEGDYLNALLAEITAQPIPSSDTLYIGGGTPSGIDPPVIEKLRSALPGIWQEGTIEAAPGTLTSERIRAWRRAGVNRVSLGVQSFVRAELARTGRRHDHATVLEDVALLRAEGILNISIDLIAGLPGQTVESWQTSLDALIALEVPHASVYMLEIDDDSRLGSEILLGGKRYGAFDVPSDDRIATFYETAVDQLAREGIRRYEISNFARDGCESLHNLKYWRREPYLGFGSDAHSFDGVTRWQNVETAPEYVGKSQNGESVRAESTRPDPVEEKFFVGLRLAEGVQPDESDWLRYGSAFTRHLASGMMESDDGRLRLTNRGIMVSNEIFQDFIAA
jgi:oxygen-independent coproporphyrinogen-3 oxidase